MSQSRIERMTSEARIASPGKLAVVTIAAIAAVVILTLTSVTSSELTAGETAASPDESASFTYFPGQYTSQATEPSEHIPAF